MKCVGELGKRSNSFVDISGLRFGRLMVLNKFRLVRYRIGTSGQWLCRCDCGTEKFIAGSALRSGATKSCGCLAREMLLARATTHGMTKTLEHATWRSMFPRCYDKSIPGYRDYGARGIYICRRWHKFENFFEDMGPRPSKAHSIDRINNNGPYSPTNCRWATRKEQCRNRRSTKLIAHNGETKTAKEWAIELGFRNDDAISGRLRRGSPVKWALLPPLEYAKKMRDYRKERGLRFDPKK